MVRAILRFVSADRINIQGSYPYGSFSGGRYRGVPYGTIPRDYAELVYEIYANHCGGRGQDLDTVSRRGGWGHGEMDTMTAHPDFKGERDWRKLFEPSENMRKYLPDMVWPPEGYAPPQKSDEVKRRYPWLS